MNSSRNNVAELNKKQIKILNAKIDDLIKFCMTHGIDKDTIFRTLQHNFNASTQNALIAKASNAPIKGEQSLIAEDKNAMLARYKARYTSLKSNANFANHKRMYDLTDEDILSEQRRINALNAMKIKDEYDAILAKFKANKKMSNANFAEYKKKHKFSNNNIIEQQRQSNTLNRKKAIAESDAYFRNTSHLVRRNNSMYGRQNPENNGMYN